jgi:hypothetical protein
VDPHEAEIVPMFPGVMFVAMSRRSIRDRQACYSLLLFLSGSGMYEMDFISGLPRTPKGNDAKWVIIDTFSKVAHFIPVKSQLHVIQMAELYLSRIASLHGVPKRIHFDRGSLLTSRF